VAEHAWTPGHAEESRRLYKRPSESATPVSPEAAPCTADETEPACAARSSPTSRPNLGGRTPAVYRQGHDSRTPGRRSRCLVSEVSHVLGLQMCRPRDERLVGRRADGEMIKARRGRVERFSRIDRVLVQIEDHGTFKRHDCPAAVEPVARVGRNDDNDPKDMTVEVQTSAPDRLPRFRNDEAGLSTAEPSPDPPDEHHPSPRSRSKAPPHNVCAQPRVSGQMPAQANRQYLPAGTQGSTTATS
jgi:hypothetical protein